jgi:hypothetical protein
MDPIFIPSRGRAGKAKFLAACVSEALPFTVICEPQEFHTYASFYPQVVQLPESNKGITYARNFIRTLAEDLKVPEYWICDDDIDGLYERQGKKMIRNTAKYVMEGAEVVMNGFKVYALEYQQLAWSASKAEVYNSYLDVCVHFDTEATRGLRYDPAVEGKEDRDFAMQLVKLEFTTARSTLFAFSAPKNGSNAGGLKEIFYDAGREQLCVEAMVNKWGPMRVTPVIKKDGRRDVKIHWDKLKIENQSFFS